MLLLATPTKPIESQRKKEKRKDVKVAGELVAKRKVLSRSGSGTKECVLVRVSSAGMKHQTKNQVRVEKIYLTYTSVSLFII